MANLEEIVKELKNKNLILSEDCDLLSNILDIVVPCLMQRSLKHINPKLKKIYKHYQP